MQSFILTKIVQCTRDCVGIIAGVQHIDEPLEVKYWGIRIPVTHAALTPMPETRPQALPTLQGRSDGGISGYIPPKSAQVYFLWGKNDIKTAIQQFYTLPKNFIPPPKKKFLATPLQRCSCCFFFSGLLLSDFQSTKALSFLNRSV